MRFRILGHPLSWWHAAVVIVAGLVWFPLSQATAELFQAPFGPNGTWNVYETFAQPTSWARASDTDEVRFGAPGHLVTINSGPENDFVEYLGNSLNSDNLWIGLTDREGAAPLTTGPTGKPAPQESSLLDDPTIEGWAWVSGEQLTHTFWDHQMPIDFHRSTDVARMNEYGRWEVQRSGYGPGLPVAPTLQAGTSLDETNFSPAPYIIEYPTAAANPFDEIAIATPPPKMPPRLPGLTGSDGFLGVTTFRGDFDVPRQLHELSQLMSKIEAGTQLATSHTQRLPWTDASSGSDGGPVLDSVPFQIPGSDEIDDFDFLNGSNGTERVPDTGDYTLQERSRATFSLQIGEAEFQSASGRGYLNDADARNLVFAGTTGADSSTRAVVNLEAGDHEFKFISSVDVFDAYWEISSAQGRFESPYDAQWLALGDDSTRQATTVRAIAQLTGPATVTNVTSDVAGRVTSIADARDAIELGLESDQFFQRSDVESLVIRDHDWACCGRPAEHLAEDAVTIRWPVNEADFGGSKLDADHFASSIEGQFTIDDGDNIENETHLITLAMFSNEGSALHVDGVNFLESLNASLEDVDGDIAMVRDGVVANSNAFGLLEVTEGIDYDFDIFTYDRTGDSGFELWIAEGNRIDRFSHEHFVPLGYNQVEVSLPGNQGLQFVAAGIPGDFNGDGQLDAQDLSYVASAIRTQDLSFDDNLDGVTDHSDLLIWVKEHRQSWIGDANLDGEFNTTDLVQVLSAGTYEQDVFADWQTGDWDGDERFTTSDLVRSLQDGGYENGPRRASVPEPRTSVYLLLLWLPFARQRNHPH